MNGMELLEKMDTIAPAFVQEADKPFRSAKKPAKGNIIRLYAVGLAAGFVMLLVSAGLFLFNGNITGTEPANATEWAATALGQNGSIALILLILSLVVIALFAFLLIRRKKRD